MMKHQLKSGLAPFHLQCLYLFAAKAIPTDLESCSVQSSTESADVFFQIAVHKWNLHQSSISAVASSATDKSTSKPMLWAPVKWSAQNSSKSFQKKARSSMAQSRPWLLSLSVEALGALPDSEDASALTALPTGKKLPKVVDPPDGPGNIQHLRPSGSTAWGSLPVLFHKSVVFLWTLGVGIVIFFVAVWSVVHFAGQIKVILKHGLHGKHGDEDHTFVEYQDGLAWRPAERVHETHDEILLRNTGDGTLTKKDKKKTNLRKATKPSVVPSRVVAMATAAPSLGERMVGAIIPEKPVVWTGGAEYDSGSASEQSEDEYGLAEKVAMQVGYAQADLEGIQAGAEKTTKHSLKALKKGMKQGKEKVAEMKDDAQEAAEDATQAVLDALDDPGAALMQAAANLDDVDDVLGNVGKGVMKVGDKMADAMDDAMDDMAEAAKSKFGRLLGGKKENKSSKKEQKEK